MSRSFNQVILVGNVARDAETRTVGSAPFTQFSVGTSHRYKSGEEWKEDTTFTNVVAWRQDKVAEYLTKGRRVFVRGRLQTRSYEKDGRKIYATEVVAEEIILEGGERKPNNNSAADDDVF